MPECERVTLIIDANNLAHHLDHLESGQPLSTSEVLRLATHLSSYAKTAQPPVKVELCFDPLPPGTEVPVLPWVRCLVAAPSSSADDLLRERFRYYHHHHARSIVITNDGEIREDVEDEGGECLLVYDFVRRSGQSPVFRQPGEFKAVRIRSTAPVQRKRLELDWSKLVPPLVVPGSPKVTAVEPLPVRDELPMDSENNQQASSLTAANTEINLPDPAPPQPVYRLALENWPLENGLRFLLDAFCPAHQAEENWLLYRSLSASEIQSDDLRDLANLLRQRCGSEAGFAQQGSLMKRVRLALIQAEDQQLSLPELIEATSLNARGLQGRIREKASPWLEIIHS
jgi:hypothetical protein